MNRLSGTLKSPLWRRRRFLVALVTLVVCGVCAASAAAWSQRYVSGAYICQFCLAGSGFNYVVDWNEASYDTSELTNGVLSLCPSSGNCYSGHTIHNGYGYDTREISYGQAVCGPADGTLRSLENWFYYCDTSNN